jgi:glycosyltransferase involved in cell wall biosynthesis
MAQHDIYVLPSNAYEGWGAVINEAMACGCAIVASKGAGAAAAMINNEVNGLLFSIGDWRELSSQLDRLIHDVNLRQKLSTEAIRTTQQVWSPQVVANRFHGISDALLSNREVPIFASGPMSRVRF